MLTIDSPPPVSLRPVNTTSVTTPTTPTSTGSLYHICRSVLDRLRSVQGMAQYLTDSCNSDPLSKLTEISRQGFPLCVLYNALQPAKLLRVDTDPNLNAVNSCKANVYHFIVACRQELLFPEEDMFTITDLYVDDTNGFVKVVNTINKLLQLLEHRGIITCDNNLSDHHEIEMPKNMRDKVVFELLETERKYVQDMETLQNYMRELQIQKVVSPDTVHYLFGNLNSLVDFQRRFLIQLEEIAEKSRDEQRIGSLFIQMEELFAVYEPYCSNYYSAQDLVVQETPRLTKLTDISTNPIYELTSLLIKPVQRICKYPLLLQELLKSTDKSWSYYGELEDAVASMKRVTEKVNETQRQHENNQVLTQLKKRLDDFKMDGYGNLLLEDKLTVTQEDEKELHVFFFENVFLFCKEQSKSNLSTTLNKKKRRGSLVPKFIIQTNSVISHQKSTHQLLIQYLNDQQIVLKFKNEEKVNLWSATLSKQLLVNHEKIHLDIENDIINDDDDELDEEQDLLDDEDDLYMVPSLSSSTSTTTTTTTTTTTVLNRSRSSSFNIKEKTRQPPGMNLSPLPRNSNNYGYYPASPPPSHPSSPTTTTTLRHYTTATTSKPQMMLKTGRSQSQSAATTILPRPQLPLNQNRSRSQSTPNIMKDEANSIIPQLPTSKKLGPIDMSTPMATPPTPGAIKIKLSFNDGIYVIVSNHKVTFFELMEKVDKKIRLVANLKLTDVLRLKYQDEDGDYITINSDDDVAMAFETRGIYHSVNLFVSL